MKENEVNHDNQNVSFNNNYNGALNDKTCLKAIPYEIALQQNGWRELKPIGTALLPVEPFDPIQVPYLLDGNAHVFDKAIVYDGSNIYDNAKVSGSARVGPCAKIHDNAHVSGKAQICQFTTIYGNAVLKENKKFSEDVCGADQDINNAA